MSKPTPARAYGYIRWRSNLTGKEGGGTAPVADPAREVTRLNNRYPKLEHWFIPA